MLIKALGFAPEWKAVPINLKQLDEVLKDTRADLVLLPEMFSTGFCMEAEELAPYAPDALAWMKNKANTLQAAVGGTVIVKEEGKYYNRFYFVHPDGKVDTYDKKHLFTKAEEDKHFTAGTQRVIVEYQGWRILLQTCFDLRFPVFARNRGDYDMILYPACWPEKRILAWNTLLPARSVENQAVVVGANCTGTDGQGNRYPFSCGAWFPDGKKIGKQQGDSWEVEVCFEELQNFRQKYPFLKEADAFELR